MGGNGSLETAQSCWPKTAWVVSLLPWDNSCALILQARSEAMQEQLESTLLQLQELKLQKLELEQQLHCRTQASSAPREVRPFLWCCLYKIVHDRLWCWWAQILSHIRDIACKCIVAHSCTTVWAVVCTVLQQTGRQSSFHLFATTPPAIWECKCISSCLFYCVRPLCSCFVFMQRINAEPFTSWFQRPLEHSWIIYVLAPFKHQTCLGCLNIKLDNLACRVSSVADRQTMFPLNWTPCHLWPPPSQATVACLLSKNLSACQFSSLRSCGRWLPLLKPFVQLHLYRISNDMQCCDQQVFCQCRSHKLTQLGFAFNQFTFLVFGTHQGSQ